MDEELVDDPAAAGPSQAPVGQLFTSENNPPTNPSSRPLVKAVIWNHFSKTNPNEAKCLICKKTLKTPTGVTSSLIRHLQFKHTSVYKTYMEDQTKSIQAKTEKQKLKLPAPPKQTRITEMFKSTEKWAPSHPKSKMITNTIGRWMAQSLHPYSLVEEEGFRDLMNIVEPKYSIPSRTTFSRSVIPELYNDTKKRITTTIKQNANNLASLAITTDLWTSASNDSYIAVTGHYLDSDFSIKSYCLGNSYFPEDHSGINIFMKLSSMLDEWGLNQSDTMPIFCVTDNAANMVTALTLSPWTHLRCFAHTIQLALSDAKKEVPGMLAMLSKARAIVGHYKHSSAAQSRLNKIQVQLCHGEQPLQLIQDCETRWNSEFKMLSRLVRLKAAISAELATSSKPHNLTSSEWELAEGYIQILKPLDDATTLSSSGFLPTLSAVLPLIDGVRDIIKKYIAAGKKGVMFARALNKSINTRFPSDQYFQNKHYLLAMIVDPRYKVLILDEVSKKVAIEHLEMEAMKFHSSQVDSTTDSREDISVPVEDSFSLWRRLETLSEKPQPVLTKEIIVKNQVETYVSAPTIRQQENPCEWWKANANSFGLVALVAKRYLGIPATEVPSERVFSSAGNVVSERRRSLTQDHVSELVFLHHNF